jgi:uncharacterized protein YbbC (DUF1343 family)
MRLFFLLLINGLFFSVKLFSQTQEVNILKPSDIKTGAQQFETYLPLLKDKRVAIVANITSKIGKSHLVDTLLYYKMNIKKIFSPEHGFRGEADAGEKVTNQKDTKTGLPVISLYGKHNKPTVEELKDVDIILYDIQDVGVRFYTYISTMTYCMEACAENKKQFIVLDRPNPNGFFIDGPVLDLKWKSFLGLHPVPLVYGMTCGEYAQMINGEGWLNNKLKCNLKVIPVIGYSHKDSYELPVKPSPNLPNMTSVYLYPSLGLFEGTIMSVGRGTEFPFQVLGHPDLKNSTFSFTPNSKPKIHADPESHRVWLAAHPLPGQRRPHQRPDHLHLGSAEFHPAVQSRRLAASGSDVDVVHGGLHCRHLVAEHGAD